MKNKKVYKLIGRYMIECQCCDFLVKRESGFKHDYSQEICVQRTCAGSGL